MLPCLEKRETWAPAFGGIQLIQTFCSYAELTWATRRGALQVPQFVPSSSPACCIPSIPFHLLHASSSRSSFSRRWPGLDPEVTYDLALNFFAGSARTHGKTVLNQPIVSERKQIPVLHNLASRCMDGASEQCKEIVTSNARATLLAASPESNQ